MRKTLPLIALACAAALPGCGSSGQTSAAAPEDKQSDKRGAVIACLTERHQLDARAEGTDAIQIDGKAGPHIRFFLTSGEAEAEQFEGRAEGSEQISSALLYPRQGSDDTLQQVEDCLANY